MVDTLYSSSLARQRPLAVRGAQGLRAGLVRLVWAGGLLEAAVGERELAEVVVGGSVAHGHVVMELVVHLRLVERKRRRVVHLPTPARAWSAPARPSPAALPTPAGAL